MNNIAIKLGPISIYWYSILIIVGIVIAMCMILKERKRQKMNKDFFINLIFYIILFGIIGARVYYVLFNLDYYLKEPLEIFMVWHGGLAIHGGIIAGILVTIIYCAKYKVSIMKTLDILCAGLITGQIIGRWGNFFNQEAYGQATTKLALQKLKIPNFIIEGMKINETYYQPTFLYESLWNVIGLIIILIIRRRKYAKKGDQIAFYMMWYSIGRLVIEHYRSDSLMLGPIKIAQLVSIILIIVGLIILIKNRKGSRFDNLYNGEENAIRF